MESLSCMKRNGIYALQRSNLIVIQQETPTKKKLSSLQAFVLWLLWYFISVFTKITGREPFKHLTETDIGIYQGVKKTEFAGEVLNCLCGRGSTTKWWNKGRSIEMPNGRVYGNSHSQKVIYIIIRAKNRKL